jgi:recombinase
VSRPPCCPDVATRIKAMRHQGYSLQKIADLLNDEGVPTPMGRSPWKKSHVYELLGRLYVRELPVEPMEAE